MSDNFKPMLAGKAPALDALRYPVLVSPKLDGVRAIVRSGRVLSRNLLEIPCPTVQELFGDPLFNGFDGELIVGDPTAPDAFRRTSSLVMSHDAIDVRLAPLVFHVFDDWSEDGPFEERLAKVVKRIRKGSKIFSAVPHARLANAAMIETYESLYVGDGYEGIMLRDPQGEYKFGRSTTKEGGLLKLKRFEDMEATIIGFKELKHNENEDRTGGLAKRRSTKQAGKRGGQVLGAFQVKGLSGPFRGVEFDVGTGLSHADRVAFWEAQGGLLGKILRCRYFPLGSKDKPRFPVFQGFRHKADL